MSNEAGITIYGGTTEDLQEALTELKGRFPSYFNYATACPTGDYLAPDAKASLSLTFADEVFKRNSDGVSSQVVAAMKNLGYPAHRITDMDNKIRLKLTPGQPT